MIESKQIKNPFPGLRPFETDEYRLFFGREGQSDALIARLQRSHFLAVVGTSGSGKSSLVRAGLLPALRGGLMAGAGSGWRIAIMRPGSDPIGNLAMALVDRDVLLEAGGGLPPAEAEAVIEATLRRGALGLVEVARQARLAGHEKLLVVVDQFEELFRYRAARPSSSTGDDASAFVKLLLEAAQQDELSIYVVPTMRSDFLGDCAQFQGLPEAINDGQYLIPRMTRDERRFAISGPVGVTRGKISEPLVNRLMNDVGDNPDQLPILQHALMRTWDYWATHRRNGEPLGLEHYEAVGTMADALSKHADEAYSELPDERNRLIAEALFKALTERGADNREIRRPTRLSAICAIAGASLPEVAAVIEVFRGGGRSFLMPPAGLALESETVIDISHESLIRNWLRLKEWVNEEAQSARIYRRLAEAAVLHREGREGLLQDPALQIALDWYEKNQPTAAWAHRYYPGFDESVSYLKASSLARDAAAAAEREREQRELAQTRAFAEQQARANRRLRWLATGMAVMFLLALGGAGYAYAMGRRAQGSEDNAHKARVRAEQSERKAIEQTNTIAALLKKTEAEQLKAQQQAEIAEQQTEIAKAKEIEAEREKSRANEQARIAQAETARARAEEKRANAQAAIIKVSQQANENFREGSSALERQEYKAAADNFAAATERFAQVLKLEDQGRLFEDETGLREGGGQQILYKANVIEGQADAYFQRGRVNFAAWQTERLEEDQIGKATAYFDTAASLYSGYDVANPNKAAETLFTASTLLTKFSENSFMVSATDQTRLSSVLDAVALYPSPQSSGMLRVKIDLEQIQRDAVERYRRAFEFYKQADNKEGMIDTAFRIGSFHKASPDSNNKRLAIQYYEEVRKLLPPDQDAARLFLWLGELNQDVGSKEKADEYLELAVRDIMKYRKANAGAASLIAGDFMSLSPIAAKLYEKALAASRVDDDLSTQAAVLFKLGKTYEAKEAAKAAQYYDQAFETFKQAYARGDTTRHSDLLAAISSFAMEHKNERLAGEAHDLAIAFEVRSAEKAFENPRNDEGLPWRQAAKPYAVGNVYRKANDEQQARKYYRESVELYGQALQAFKATPQAEYTPTLSALMIPDNLLEIGSIANDESDYQLALAALSLALNISQVRESFKFDVANERISALLRLGQVYDRMNQPEKALEFSEKGLAIQGGYVTERDQIEMDSARALIRKLKMRLREPKEKSQP